MADPLTHAVTHVAAHLVKHAAPAIEEALDNLADNIKAWFTPVEGYQDPDKMQEMPCIHDIHPGS
ncbi:hypothetical protein ACFQ7M_40195 [Streptomyces massasporeus]